jgi:NAD(P)-dependent dehydrogenase (short-subunit alcohol dehydrogenase family)
MSGPEPYFVTGATGFIGRRLVDRLLERGVHLHLLVRPASSERCLALLEAWRSKAEEHGGWLRVLTGDLAEPRLGLGTLLPERLEHVFHLGAAYRLGTPEAASRAANVDGTRHLLEALEEARFTGVLHHVSSIAVAGDFSGTFTESMLEAGQEHRTPYLRTKLEAERLVRASALRWRVYRPSAVVGDSRTGETDKADGPYYVFGPIQRLRQSVPSWIPLAAPAVGSFNIVPVDFVAAALDHIAHLPGRDGQTFHLVDPAPPDLAETLDLVLEAAHGPRIRWMWKPPRRSPLNGVAAFLAETESARFLLGQHAEEWDVPREALEAFNPWVRFDASVAAEALAGSGIECPPLASYVERLWSWWELHLDPERRKPELRRRFFPGKTILVTGASSGIGEALALECGRLGAHVVLVARRAERLQELAGRIGDLGGRASVLPANLALPEDCERVVERCLAEAGVPDVLVLNAAKSIRRPLAQTIGRFHDLERTMALNYFGAARLVMGFLPAMRERGSGHVVHSSTWGTLQPSPRYAAYQASKAALDVFLESFAAEFLSEGLHVTHVFLPWVRTPMVEPARAISGRKMLSPEEAAELLVDAMVRRPRTMTPPQAYWTTLARLFLPKASTRILNLLYRLWPDEPGQHAELDPERQLLRQYFKHSPM